MDGEGLFKLLPNEVLSKILDYNGTMNLRCVSSSLETRVSDVKRSKCNEINIQIFPRSLDEINKTLTKAMAKKHAPEKLNLKFPHGKLKLPMAKILEDFKDNVSSLTIGVYGNKNLLLKSRFESLESLSISFVTFFKHPNDMSQCNAFLSRHCHKLKKLMVSELDRNLVLPSLPVLHSLALHNVQTNYNSNAAWNLVEHCRPTITSLDLKETRIVPPPLEIKGSAAYKIPNLTVLKLDSWQENYNWVLFNSENLVCLDLNLLAGFGFISEDMDCPQLPKLRELRIEYSFIKSLVPAFEKFGETLEFLVICSSVDNTYAVDLPLPRLTDLYMLNCPIETDYEFLETMLRSNPIEFLYLKGVEVSGLNVDIRIQTMKIVILNAGSENSPRYDDSDRNMLKRMCPNAEVILCIDKDRAMIKGLMNSRKKRKGFNLDFSTLDANWHYDWI